MSSTTSKVANEIISAAELDLIMEQSEQICTNIDADPLKLALKGVAPAICNQIKYLKRAKDKLPSYFAKFCIIPSLSYEQSSSEATAKAKDFGAGELAVDLTCGLGVDSLYLSRKFKRVITIERNEMLCRVARENFRRLGAANIEVVEGSSEEFLKNNSNLSPDLIYVDPARRDQTKKVFLLEDCSPDMNKIMPLATKMAKKVAVKLSPMFDVAAARDFFGQYGSCLVESVSLRGECKEVVVVVNCGSSESDKNCAVVVDNEGNTSRFCFDFDNANSHSSSLLLEEVFRYIYIADVAFYKSRTVVQLFENHYKCGDFAMATPNSPIFTNQNIEDFAGERYTIINRYSYKPKELKKLLKKSGSKAKIIKKDFLFSTEQIKRDLSIKDGASPTLIFTGKEVYEVI